jgi:hypothetical protein
MVQGLKKFKESFINHTNQYVLIGGTACEILMNELGAEFRATKDLDMVLIIEALDESFGKTFWKFIEEGGYELREKSAGENQFYRFTSPTDSSFPKMIELFSRKPINFELNYDNGLTPIHIEESIVSLSAILLDDDYYDLLLEGNITVDGYSVIRIETVILFKVKAWLDLKSKRESGEQIDSRNIKKHKNDIFRLLVNINPSIRVNLSEEIQDDVHKFINLIEEYKPDLKGLGIRGASFEELIDIFKNIYLGVSEAL